MSHPCRSAVLLLLAALSWLGCLGCRAEDDGSAGAWARRDLWRERPQVEAYPFGDSSRRPFGRVISYLGTAEVRDLSRVPPQQLINIPKRTAAQVRALEQRAGSRLQWRVRVGPAAYVSFIPLGTPADRPPCACTFRMGVRSPDGAIHELSRLAVQPMGPIAQAVVEVPLAAWEGQEIDLLFQIDGPPGLAPGQPVPTALWGSPALYERGPAPDPARAASRRPNVLLIGLDTLRADALGAWGRSPSLTPSLDRLAEESDVWLDAYSTFNVTNPSFVSILTGLYGKDHGVYDLQTPLPRSHTTLAELFSSGGYDTMAVISARHLGDHNSGLGQGFEEVTTASEHLSAEMAVDTTLDWLAARGRRGIGARGAKGARSSEQPDRPFFAWVHLFDPHTPHTPPEPYAVGFRPSEATGLAPVATWTPFRPPGPRTFDEPVLGGHRDLYDGEVAYLDRHLGRLLDFLESRGYLEDTVVALVADHGENLGDHGVLYRHLGLWDSTTHVPLLIRRPGASLAGRRHDRHHRSHRGLVQTLDLFPTLLRLAGLPVPAQDGQDLDELTKEGSTGRRAVFAEHAGRLGLMVRTDRHLYTLSQGNNPRLVPDGPALYDLAADPAQATNLAGRGLPAEREMDALLKRWLAARRPAPRPEARTLSPEEEQRLRALGYN
ncbi:MAG TPA: sulfatase [Thermoanaerobaculia bacterium]|nr:sulfatase [Thermoanaerobaculia bacterium]